MVDADTRLHGTFDVPLSPAGLQQMRGRLTQGPSRPPPSALYTSPLRRAVTVAAALGRAWSLEPCVVDWAREIHCGDVEGMRFEELQVRFHDSWMRNQAQDDDGFAWPGGESYREFRERVLRGLSTTAAAHTGERIAVVTHAGVISQVLGVVRHRRAAVWSVDRPEPFTATEVTWAGRRPVAVLTYNDRDWY
jgi:2,3-bisphosphoglycerate-dependent phosphoglycerate mutase